MSIASHKPKPGHASPRDVPDRRLLQDPHVIIPAGGVSREIVVVDRMLVVPSFDLAAQSDEFLQLELDALRSEEHDRVDQKVLIAVCLDDVLEQPDRPRLYPSV